MNRIHFEPRVICLLAVALSSIGIASCKLTGRPADSREENRLDQGWRKTNKIWQATSYPPLTVALPEIPGAEYVHEDVLCQVCHKTHVDAFQYNVHRQHHCEDCHGPASRHLDTRGKEPGLIRNFRTMKRAERAEVCATCHAQTACDPGGQWRTSAHAHHGVDCMSCHAKVHYNVPEGTPKVNVEQVALLPYLDNWKHLVAQLRSLNGTAGHPADDPDTQEYLVTAEPPKPSTADDPADTLNLLTSRQPPPDSEPIPAPVLKPLSGVRLASDSAKEELPSLRGTSNNLGAVTPAVCYQCHTETYELEAIAHPHQINGPNGFNCSTCHDAHGNVLTISRTQLCLQCHQDSPTTAWHSSIHEQSGVACTDCHNPHPDASVQETVNIRHSSIRRPPRLPMSVYEPYTCYKCHPAVQAEFQLPSHHPVLEGKMVCSTCHDPHGRSEGSLTEPTLNLVCYRCHADKQGPYVYQHPPVEENCAICHTPHGAVANNLLRQPPTFLCLRCHAGHRAAPSEHFGIGTSDIDGNPALRPVYYTNCINCHTQIHGSDLPSQHRPGALLR